MYEVIAIRTTISAHIGSDTCDIYTPAITCGCLGFGVVGTLTRVVQEGVLIASTRTNSAENVK